MVLIVGWLPPPAISKPCNVWSGTKKGHIRSVPSHWASLIPPVGADSFKSYSDQLDAMACPFMVPEGLPPAISSRFVNKNGFR